MNMYRSRKSSKVPSIKNIDELGLSDLKKLKKFHLEYQRKLLHYQQRKASAEAHNANIKPENDRMRLLEKMWEQSNIDPLWKEYTAIHVDLTRCMVGLVGQFFSDTFEFEGYRYKTNPGKEVVARLSRIISRIDSTEAKRPTFHYLREEPIPRAPKDETSLNIGGIFLKIHWGQLDIKLLDGLLAKHDALENERKSHVEELKARAATTDKEKREQAQKFRSGLSSQLSKSGGCPYCGGSLQEGDAHLDHIWPVSEGGLSSQRNLVFVCSSCNIKKTNMSLRSFLRKSGYQDEAVYQRLELLKKKF
jgi:5-methylcytosine-specific restriction endonuclease McrA